MRKFFRITYNLLNPGIFAALLVMAGRYRGFTILWPQCPEWLDATLLVTVCAWFAIIYRHLFERFTAGGKRKTGNIFAPGTRFFQIALLLLGGLFLISVSWSAAPEYGLEKTVYFLIYAITWSALILRLKDEDVDILLKTLLVVALLLTAAAVFPLLPEIAAAFAAGESIVWGRLAAIGGGPNVFSRFTSVAFLAALYYAIKTPSWLVRFLLCPVLAVLGAATYLSGSRGSFLGLVGALLVYMLLRIIVRRQHLVANVAVLLALILVLSFLVFGLDVQNRYLPAWEDLRTQASDRFYCAERSLELGAASPWIGWGTGSFAHHVPEAHARYPHNIFLELYAENGMLGLLLLALLLASIAGNWFKALRLCSRSSAGEKEQIHLLAALLIFSFLVAQVSGDTVDSRWIWFSGFLIANCYLRLKEGKGTVIVEKIPDQN